MGTDATPAKRIAEAAGNSSSDIRRLGISPDSEGLAAVWTRLIDRFGQGQPPTFHLSPHGGASGLAVVDLQNDILLSQRSGDIANFIGEPPRRPAGQRQLLTCTACHGGHN